MGVISTKGATVWVKCPPPKKLRHSSEILRPCVRQLGSNYKSVEFCLYLRESDGLLCTY